MNAGARRYDDGFVLELMAAHNPHRVVEVHVVVCCFGD